MGTTYFGGNDLKAIGIITAIGIVLSGGISALSGTFTNVDAQNTTSTVAVVGQLTATSSARLPADTQVNSKTVCLNDGTNCPASGGSQTLTQVTALGSSATATLQLYGGFLSASSTVTSTLTVLGNTALQTLGFTRATGTSLVLTGNLNGQQNILAAGSDASPGAGRWFDFSQTATDTSGMYTDASGNGVTAMTRNTFTVNAGATTTAGHFMNALDSTLYVPTTSRVGYYDLAGNLSEIAYYGSGNTSQLGAIEGEAYNGGSGVSAFMGGGIFTSFNTGVGTTTWNNGFYTIAGDYGAGGHIASNYGVYIDGGFGTVANNYGLYIADQRNTGSTSKWSIYTNGGDVSFGNGNLFVNNGSVSGTSLLTSGALTVGGSSSLKGLTFTVGTSTSVTTTNLAVTTGLMLPANSITDAMVVAGLTISGGTIDNSVIGATTPLTGIFTQTTSTNATTTSLYISNLFGFGGGGIVHRNAINTATYTVLSTDFYLAVSTTNQAVTLSLPSATSALSGTEYIIKDRTNNASVKNITINPNGTNTIDSTSTLYLAANGQSTILISDGVSNWEVLAN